MKKLNTIEKEILGVFIACIILCIVVCYSYSYFRDITSKNTEIVEITGIVIAKESEQEAINRFGDFRTNYYVLFESGELQEVELKEYMSFNVGDTLTWYETREK